MGVTSVRLNTEVEAPLEQLAHKLDRSKNYLINQAIKEFLIRQGMEDARWADTLEALDSVKDGRMADAKEVTEWLQSWGDKKPKPPPGV